MSPKPTTRTVLNGFFPVTLDEYKALDKLPRETLIFIDGANWIRIHHYEEFFVMENQDMLNFKASPKFREIVKSFWGLNPDPRYRQVNGVTSEPFFYKTFAYNLIYSVRFIQALLSASFTVYLSVMTEESQGLHEEEVVLKQKSVSVWEKV
jgi:hypothetical protein